MTTQLMHSDLEQVYRAIHTLYSQDQSIPYTDKQAASTWLNQFQHSVKKDITFPIPFKGFRV